MVAPWLGQWDTMAWTGQGPGRQTSMTLNRGRGGFAQAVRGAATLAGVVGEVRSIIHVNRINLTFIWQPGAIQGIMSTIVPGIVAATRNQQG